MLYVSFDYIDGTSSVDWSKVASVESTRLFVVKMEDGSGVLFPAAQLVVNNEGELQFELNQNAWKLNNIIEWK